jgi:hypothetical protein
MKKIVLIIATAAAVISAPTMAQNVTYACQYLDSGGFNWKNGKWEITKFRTEAPFFLIYENEKIDTDSLEKALKAMMFKCENLGRNTYCISFLGKSFVFDKETMSGGVSILHGASMPNGGNYKDSIAVSPFTCTKM